ncbi:MAG TPA: hypothetical protein VE422_38800 [Terriglobia bacterium]|nr:hypothetical protein [Terriglobia bacterium]
MNRTSLQKALLVGLCSLALVLITYQPTYAAQQQRQQQQQPNVQNDRNTNPNDVNNSSAEQNRSTSDRSNRTNAQNDPANRDNSALPATAGELPLLGLAGCLSLLAGLAVRFCKQS